MLKTTFLAEPSDLLEDADTQHLFCRKSAAPLARVHTLATTPAEILVHQLDRRRELIEHAADHGQLACVWMVDQSWNEGQLIE